MDENNEDKTKKNQRWGRKDTTKSKNSNQLLKFEDRMSVIALNEFQIKENDFPSLTNESLKTSEHQQHQPIVSYSEKVSKPQPAASNVKPTTEQPNETSENQETTSGVKKKKRKRAKKMKADPSATLRIGTDLPEKLVDNIQINLEDLEEYPALSSAPNLQVIKPTATISTPEKSESSAVEVKNKSTKVPGILKVPSSVIKNQTKVVGKKSKTPVEINIFDVLIKPKKQAEVKAKKLNLTFNVKKGKLNNQNKISPHNVLDSTAPIRKRGKEREKPKKAKLSKLKKIILLEREIRRHLQDENIPPNLQIETATPEKLEEKIIEDVPKLDETSLDEKTKDDQILEEIPVENTDKTIETSDKTHETSDKTIETSDKTIETSDKTHETPETEKESKYESLFVIPSTENDEEQKEMLFCVKKVVHSRKYREYCNQRTSQEIDSNLEQLLQDLVRFQDRQFQKDPVKAKIRKRMVFGLKEVTKNLKLNKIKFVIIAPDVERILAEGGLNDAIATLIKCCDDHKVPVVFGLLRRKLGFICKKSVPLSCIGVVSYEGKEELYKTLMELVAEAREAYETLIGQVEKLITPSMKETLTNPEPNDKKLQEIKRNIFSQL